MPVQRNLDGPAIISASGVENVFPKATNTPVRRAAQLQAIDPFVDPFGDQSTQRTDKDEPNQQEPMPLKPPVNAKDTLKIPLGNEKTGDPPPKVPLNLSDVPRTDEKPCKEVYNDRDCCKEDGKCKSARKKLKDNPISNILLDITPQTGSFPAGSKVSRTWKNCRNEKLAVGSMTDYRNGRVYVTKEDGSVVPIVYGELSNDDLCFVAAWRGLPTECKLDDVCQTQGIDSGRDWLASTFTWKASALCHKPLYFEEVQLERYGHTAGPLLQPILSGAHFFTNIATLPYKMGINPPNECRYALGYYRPGDCAPWLVEPVPLSVRGGLLQAGAVVGGIYIIP